MIPEWRSQMTAMKRVLAIFVTILMIISVVPVLSGTAYAADRYNIVIPADQTEIRPGEYMNKPIESVTFEPGSKLEIIGVNAFLGCTSLTDITIPASVKKIDNAFRGCDSLTDVWFGGDEAGWNAMVPDRAAIGLENVTVHFGEKAPEPVSGEPSVTEPPVPALPRGDADGDGKVLAKDARLALRASAKLETLDAAAFARCDLDGDGRILAGEARKILRYSAKLEKEI